MTSSDTEIDVDTTPERGVADLRGYWSRATDSPTGEMAEQPRKTRPGKFTPPTFSKILDLEISGMEGHPLVLEVNVKGTPLPQVQWFREGAPIQNNPAFTVDQTGEVCTLVIAEAYPEDSGNYTATAANFYGSQSCQAIVTVKGKDDPGYIPPPPASNGPAVLPDTPLPPPPANVQPTSGLMDDLPPPPPEEERKGPDAAVRAQQTRVTDEYHDRLRNPPPAQQEEFRVSGFEERLMREIEHRLEKSVDAVGVFENVPQAQWRAPMFGKRVQNYKVLEGGTASFSCRVVGLPTPKIYWFKDGQEIPPDSEKYLMQSAPDGTCYLHIPDATLHVEGQYTIMAVSPAGKASATGMLKVQEKKAAYVKQSTPVARAARTQARDREDLRGVAEKNYRPNFVQVPEETNAKEGGLVRLDCKVTGLPSPDLVWIREGSPLRQDSNHKMIVRENGVHSLLISQCKASDAGDYTCVATNKAGQAEFTVTLNILVEAQAVAPTWVQKLKNTTVKEGEHVRIFCTAAGDPVPYAIWKKDGIGLTDKSGYRLGTDGQGTFFLEVDHASKADATWYTCSAHNQAGSIMCTGKIVVQSPWESQKPQQTKIKTPKRYANLPVDMRASHQTKTAMMNESGEDL
ncbi:PREDICTED: palladin-like isoform X2 [Branchiostoma belcheri]|uniref:Palladin-like isoform X2 n=1 Tax=Branchiostoma belcheri TaxID=7741 RepID=A0A6P4ZU59_BRABE|nr:PREDICTED: palladin-like isoform X2 [Branchiostoma belcheri]